jgi:hypothetical protein
MTPQQLYDSLTGRARSDSYTGAVPNSVWGYGKLNVDSVFAPTCGLEAKVFLEGAYSASGDTMRWDLRKGGDVPLTSPYPQDARTVPAIPLKIVDWVLVQLRATPSGAAVISKSVFLKNNGRLVADDGVTAKIALDVPAGNYYLVIRHRNHLAVMSAEPVALSPSGSAVVDFTAAAGMTYGAGGSKPVKTDVWGMIGGNANSSNNMINILDASAVKSKLSKVGYLTEDVTLSRVVNVLDNALVKSNLSKASRVP